MELKAGYKPTEVGVIPEDWSVISAFDACSKIQDGTHFSPQTSGNDYFYVTSKNIRFGYLDMSTASRIDAAQHQAIYRRCDVKKGDVLLTKDGANTGNAALNTINEEFSLLSSVAFLRFQQRKHCAAYFLQQILASQGQRQIQEAMAGNAITRLTLQKINKLRFPVPPTKAEQETIAEALSDADALIESLEQLITKKRQIKQGAMQELLTGKKRLPGFSGDWEVKLFDNVLSRVNAKTHQIQTSDYQIAGRYPVVDQGKEFVVGFSDKDEKRFRCPADGVIVFGDHTCIIKFVDFDFLVGADGTQILEAKNEQCTRFHALQLEHKGIASTGYNRHFKFLKEREFLVPPLPEQTAIATILSDMDTEIAALETKLAKTRALKQGMMHNLLTGRIRLL